MSYVVENRLLSKRMFPRVFDAARVHRVDHYPTRLAETLRSVSPSSDGTAVVLTPGTFNSAYFEHSFLARTMGLELVQAPDLFVENDKVYCRTPQRLSLVRALTTAAAFAAISGVVVNLATVARKVASVPELRNEPLTALLTGFSKAMVPGIQASCVSPSSPSPGSAGGSSVGPRRLLGQTAVTLISNTVTELIAFGVRRMPTGSGD